MKSKLMTAEIGENFGSSLPARGWERGGRGGRANRWHTKQQI